MAVKNTRPLLDTTRPWMSDLQCADEAAKATAMHGSRGDGQAGTEGAAKQDHDCRIHLGSKEVRPLLRHIQHCAACLRTRLQHVTIAHQARQQASLAPAATRATAASAATAAAAVRTERGCASGVARLDSSVTRAKSQCALVTCPPPVCAHAPRNCTHVSLAIAPQDHAWASSPLNAMRCSSGESGSVRTLLRDAQPATVSTTLPIRRQSSSQYAPLSSHVRASASCSAALWYASAVSMTAVRDSGSNDRLQTAFFSLRSPSML